ncbi:DUF447 domain-containing protein [Blastopirellula marina]|uniref:DUF447 domain-containing protein n=1 Tax=Blastopirellula marina TaxID=124 RepID=A0A2S8FSX2_9BACT|nr:MULTISPECIES: DUF447 domain-containing protein [Pirellulaceae]PQO35278.1 DUF447 domain-containing protein [Blastopirellula marina]RCS53147.1 DUF447 family protein [Bremerella cremea]
MLTTQNADGTVNVAPMGPCVDDQFTRFLLRPFPGSRTYENLLRTRQATFHVTDDVEMIAQAAVGDLHQPPAFLADCEAGYHVLAGCCRWYRLEADQIDTSGERAALNCRVVRQGHIRDFFGLNRAKHAVLELAILTTRVHILSAVEIDQAIATMMPWVEKTGGDAEVRAWEFLRTTIQERRIAARESS